jgi:hypothetical protein
MNPDGSNMTDVTEDSYCPAYSPDWPPLSTTDDVTEPIITNAPTQSLVKFSTLTPTTVRVKIGWLGTDNVSGVRYELEQSTNGGPYSSVALSSPSAISILRFLTPGNTYQYRVRAQDTAGNWSAWKEGEAFKVNVLQGTNSAITYAGSWATQNFAEALGGAVRYASTSGSSAKINISNALSIGWVSARGPDRGKADLYPDGIHRTSYGSPDLYLPTTEWRKVAFAKNGMNPSVPHTLEVKVLGQKRDASSGTRIDLDAFVVLSRP